MAPLTPGRAGSDRRPLIAHVVYRFAVGGLENGVVNLINHMPRARWRHAVVSLTEIDPVFARRIQRDDVPLIALRKPPGQGLRQLLPWRRALVELAPTVAHTRNLAALEAQLPAWLAGVPARVHGEHGRDIEDIDGTSRRHVWMRRAYMPWVQEVVALGQELSTYVRVKVGVAAHRVHTVYNGVDTERFAPAPVRQPLEGSPFNDPALWLVGTVGRMQTVKAQPQLVEAFIQLLKARPELARTMRLVLVGDGPLRAECEQRLDAAGLRHLAWLPGERGDVPDVMRGLNCFVLPSLAEGISNTILEAMASGLPVLATCVGASPELVQDEATGRLVPPGRPEALAQALVQLASQPDLAATWGHAGRQRVEQRFSLQAMVAGYEAVYRKVLGQEAPQE